MLPGLSLALLAPRDQHDFPNTGGIYDAIFIFGAIQIRHTHRAIPIIVTCTIVRIARGQATITIVIQIIEEPGGAA